MGSLKSALNRSMSGPTATTDEIKITRKRIDEMSSELTKLKKEVKLLSFTQEKFQKMLYTVKDVLPFKL